MSDIKEYQLPNIDGLSPCYNDDIPVFFHGKIQCTRSNIINKISASYPKFCMIKDISANSNKSLLFVCDHGKCDVNDQPKYFNFGNTSYYCYNQHDFCIEEDSSLESFNFAKCDNEHKLCNKNIDNRNYCDNKLKQCLTNYNFTINYDIYYGWLNTNIVNCIEHHKLKATYDKDYIDNIIINLKQAKTREEIMC
jgi:hypothetical protein